MPDNLMDKIVSLCKRRGFIFPDSEIYGGLANTWDFGPLGAEMKNNIKKEWWKVMVWHRDDVVGLDSAVIVNPKVWEASGHLSSFTDPLVECKQCHTRFRADYLKEGKYGPVVEKEGVFYCPLCGGELTKEKKFNLMFKTYIGPAEETANIAFLRPETAQGIFINFKKVLTSSRKKIPFGIAQIGKAFRNEITPSNFIFRTREFEQMEMEYFISPEEDKKWYDYWKEIRWKWYLNLGMKEENLRQRPHQEKELAHYAKEATDIEFKFPFGWSELEGIHNRTDYDLKRHQQFSNKDLSYWDEETRQKYIPYVIETSAGVERSLLAFLINAYTEEQDKNKETRVVLRLHPKIAPIKLAVLPLLKNNKELVQTARDIFLKLQRQVDYLIDYDEVGSIGRRYRRQDEVGTPWCVTIDHQTLEDQTVTIRDRDTMKQERIKTEEIIHWVEEKLCINSL
ncbi:MAG: glycine--tRNA ligase [Candidatus Hydrothermarchaeota archaeon]|nr:MAG: glycine--tRNA ligase [Candidatus Hydrothermarchaeota archaeon]